MKPDSTVCPNCGIDFPHMIGTIAHDGKVIAHVIERKKDHPKIVRCEGKPVTPKPSEEKQ